LGEFQIRDYVKNYWAIYMHIVWALSTFMIFLVLLNMLIAIVSDIFAKVHEKMNNNLLKELTQLMLDNDWLFRGMPFFRKTKYIITFTKEQGEKEDSDDISRLAALKKSMKRIGIKNELDRIYVDIIDFLSKKIDQTGK
jgi:hypothetical protein